MGNSIPRWLISGLCLSLSVLPTRSPASDVLTVTAGSLKLSLNDKGAISELTDVKTGKNYISPKWPSFLLTVQQWNGKPAPERNPTLEPKSLKVLKKTSEGALVKLDYGNGVSAEVMVLKRKGGYFAMKLMKVTPLDNISGARWGFWWLAMKGPVGRWCGLARSDDFTLGATSLELNTEGEGWDNGMATGVDRGGSRMSLVTFDRTKARKVRGLDVLGTPIPKVTVVGSKIALFGVPRGKNSELAVIEKIELGEKLPHPMFKGEWVKRSQKVKQPCIWTTVNEKTIDQCLEVAKDFAAGSLCQFHGFFKNWGHFDLDEKGYPNGFDGLKAVSAKCAKLGMHNTTYTLTTFMRPHPEAEPYIAPEPDPRLAKYAMDTKLALAKPLGKDDGEVTLSSSKGMTETLKRVLSRPNGTVKVDKEMIEYKSWKESGGNIVLSQCKRGAFKGVPASHKANAAAIPMLVAGYHNFYPGTFELNNAVARHIGEVTAKGGLGRVILDGYESCLMTGHDCYDRNSLIKIIYDMTRKSEALFSASNMGSYSWHIMSYQSWGEFDRFKGFRGTMLEHRLHHQVTLVNSLMPNKMGQYYPNDKTTLEDIEWLCAQVAGWDSGVDLCLTPNIVKRNPNYAQITAAFRLWEEARIKKAFASEHLRIALKQTGSLYHLVKNGNRYTPEFIKFWTDPRCEFLKEDAIKVTPVSGGAASVKPCDIKWTKTHNPAIYSRAALSKNLVCAAGSGKMEWKVTYPKKQGDRTIMLRYVARLAPGSTCGVKNIRVGANGQMIEMPGEINPGEYLSIPHNNQTAYIYDAKTNMPKKELFIQQSNPYWFLSAAKVGEPFKLEISCEPTKPGGKATLIVNLQYYQEMRNH